VARSDEPQRETLAERLAATRALTLTLAEPLSDADATIQPHPDASPAKWHLAHTTWFFETFVLRDHMPGYRLHDERWPFLFNSYYEGEGERHARPKRGMIGRPSLDEVREWRRVVDNALGEAMPNLPPEASTLVELGIQHEQQHQELFLTDILATFAENPLEPAYGLLDRGAGVVAPLGWIEGREGIVEVGAGEGFSFDCERPRHRALLHPHAIADRCTTNGEWDEFIAGRGYSTPSLWLSEGWDWVQANRVERPLYWHKDGSHFSLAGRHDRDPFAPVDHISYYEADAYARWVGKRLPTEFEWEAAFAHADPRQGHQLDRAGPVLPAAGGGPFGDVWQWCQSAYLPYPGFKTEAGTVGEYNGKFMCGQLVLKGASCATPRGHSRASYRNFFPPAARWQFTGVRLADDR
jgi:ergothioneine biosynthesis protein EgtB